MGVDGPACEFYLTKADIIFKCTKARCVLAVSGRDGHKYCLVLNANRGNADD